MDDDLASYLDLLEKGFGEKAIAMRSESRPGSLLELTTGDTGFENINSKGLEKNRDAVLAFMHVHDLENNCKLLTDAFVAFDVKHARKWPVLGPRKASSSGALTRPPSSSP